MAYNDNISNLDWVRTGDAPSETTDTASRERIEIQTRYEPDAAGNLYKQTRQRTVTVTGETNTIYKDVTYEARGLTQEDADDAVEALWASTTENIIDARSARATPSGMFTVTKVVREATPLKSGSTGETVVGEWGEWEPEIPEVPAPPQWTVGGVSPQTVEEETETQYTEYESQWLTIPSKYKYKDGEYIPIAYKKMEQTRSRDVTRTNTWTRVFNDTTYTITGVTYARAVALQAAAYNEVGIQSASIASAGDNLYSVTKVIRDTDPVSETGPTSTYEEGEWSEWEPEAPDEPGA